jgi:hypothetical protein
MVAPLDFDSRIQQDSALAKSMLVAPSHALREARGEQAGLDQTSEK